MESLQIKKAQLIRNGESLQDQFPILNQVFGLLQYLQLAIFFLFIVQRVEEHAQLINFILFQRGLRVESLHIVNDVFQKQEARISKRFKFTKIAIALTMAFCCVLTQIIDYKVFKAEILSSMIQVGFYMSLGNIYFWTQLRLGQLMWRRHNYEFWKHANRLVALLLVTPISTWISSTFSWLWLWNQLCRENEKNLMKSYKSAGLDPENYNDEGICQYIRAGFKDKQYGFYSSFWQTGYSFFSILPFLSFLLLTRPHDCYKCVGKDPQRRYSLFQYSVEEENIRYRSMKYGLNKEKQIGLSIQRKSDILNSNDLMISARSYTNKGLMSEDEEVKDDSYLDSIGMTKYQFMRRVAGSSENVLMNSHDAAHMSGASIDQTLIRSSKESYPNEKRTH